MKRNEHPILFRAEMINAILKGNKTQTRRVIKPEPTYNTQGLICYRGYAAAFYGSLNSVCPYGHIGDHLWVRETWAQIWKQDGCRHEEEDPQCPCGGCEVEYKADTNTKYPGGWDPQDAVDNEDAPRWHPSIHMPRWASRITLEIINIRVEKLWDIDEEGAKAEGCIAEKGEGCAFYPAKLDFELLWKSINEKTYPWDSNPWVWVIEFKKDGTNG